MTRSEIRETWRAAYWPMTTACDDDMKDPWPRYDLLDLPRPKNFAVSFSSVLDKAKQLSLFVDIDPDIIGGTPRIGGTRVPVHMILNAIEERGSIEGALESYRSLTERQVRDALRFSVHVLECPLEHESTTSY